MGFAASGGNATRQLAAVRGVGPRRVSSSRRRRRRDPRGLAPPRGTGVRRGAARPSAPRANQPDRPSLPMTRRQAALATMGLRVCHGRSQQRHALHRSAGRRVAPRSPRFRPPHSHRDRRCDADKSARGQPRHAATSPTARFISAHFHWRKSVPHPVTEYKNSLKKRFVFFVKRTIQEYVSSEFGVDQAAVLSLGWKRVLAIGVSLADSTVTAMNVQFSSLVSSDITCGLNSFTLGSELSRDAIGAGLADGPFPVSWNNV